MLYRSKLSIGLAAILVLMLLVAGCGPQMSTAVPTVAPPTATQAPEPTTPPPTTAPPTAASPSGATGEGLTTASGLQYIEIVAGEGPMPQVGEVVSVHYRGTLEDGTEFDSSYERGIPFRFALGQGMVIPGWDEGIALMQVGGKARLIVPPDLAYGESGAGETIPPNSTLVFEVELLEVQPGSPEAPVEVAEADYVMGENGLKTYDLVVGDGTVVQEGKTVTFSYTAWLDDGTKLGSTIDFGEPVTMVLGEEELLPGWKEGMIGMKVGGSRQLVIPAELANGEQGAAGGLPPETNLILEIDVLDVQ